MSDENPINKLVRCPEWQALRVSLLGKWMKEPEWAVGRLVGYLGPIETTSIDKIKVVKNYLTGTGFRTGLIKHPLITDLRQQLSRERLRRVELGEWI